MDRPVTKVIMPAAGLGTRFLPATKAQPKEMLPIVDKPAIQYVLEEAVSAGLTNVLIITGRGKRAISDHFDRSFELEYYLEKAGKAKELQVIKEITELGHVHTIRQGEPAGLGHAILCATEHVGNDPFAVMLADDIMEQGSTLLPDMIDLFGRKSGSVLALREVPIDQISSYGCAAVEVEDDGTLRITDVVEKPTPEEAPSNLAVMGRYVFTPGIFESLQRTGPGRNGEIQLTDGISDLMEREPVYGITFTSKHYDIGNKIDFLRATIEIALAREDLRHHVKKIIKEIVDDDSYFA